jgi:hypothetical protein
LLSVGGRRRDANVDPRGGLAVSQVPLAGCGRLKTVGVQGGNCWGNAAIDPAAELISQPMDPAVCAEDRRRNGFSFLHEPVSLMERNERGEMLDVQRGRQSAVRSVLREPPQGGQHGSVPTLQGRGQATLL